MIDNMPSLPFDGAISRFLIEEAPADLKALILEGDKKDILDESYPYRRILPQKNYVEEMDALQIEIAKFQSWVQGTGQRVAILFEGRDAAGKGGSIKPPPKILIRGSRGLWPCQSRRKKSVVNGIFNDMSNIFPLRAP